MDKGINYVKFCEAVNSQPKATVRSKMLAPTPAAMSQAEYDEMKAREAKAEYLTMQNQAMKMNSKPTPKQDVPRFLVIDTAKVEISTLNCLLGWMAYHGIGGANCLIVDPKDNIYNDVLGMMGEEARIRCEKK